MVQFYRTDNLIYTNFHKQINKLFFISNQKKERINATLIFNELQQIKNLWKTPFNILVHIKTNLNK